MKNKYAPFPETDVEKRFCLPERERFCVYVEKPETGN